MITVKFDIAPRDWHRFLSTTLVATTRWQETQGQLGEDEHGFHYNLKLREPQGLKRYWVLRPATLHLGAHKVLAEAHFHYPGWEKEIADLVRLISMPKKEFALAHVKHTSTLDLMTQLALFREVRFA